MAPTQKKTVATPCQAYLDMAHQWTRSRAICGGERYVKMYDTILDTDFYSNLLLPFSPSMSQEQYNFYRSEAELPGIVAQYSKIIVGGLLRKKPQIILPDDVPEGAKEWLFDQFTQDDSTITAFLDDALWEEVQTSRAWVYVDHPPVSEDLSPEDRLKYKPYPVIWCAESIINWKIGTNKDTGATQLTQILVRGDVEVFLEGDEFHPYCIPTIWVHELDPDGNYQIRVFSSTKHLKEANPLHVLQNDADYEVTDIITNILTNGERLRFIPAWPLNGQITPIEPILSPLVDREIALYNKVSRRNHLLYGAATYTPVVSSDMTDEDFEEIVGAGLGSWIKVGSQDKVDVMKTPTEALGDMEASIAATIDEMARMGIRLLAPETGEQSGVALEIRNAAQTAQLGALNARISAQMSAIIAFMLNWRYDRQYLASDIDFTLSADFNPAPLGADWLRLVTEWYQNGILPRSVFIQIAKSNDIVPPDYDDEEGQQEINQDELVVNPRQQTDFANKITQMQTQASIQQKKAK